MPNKFIIWTKTSPGYYLSVIIFIWPYKRHPLTKGFQTNFIKLICRRLPLSFHCHLLCKLSVLPIIIILAAMVVAWWRCGIVCFHHPRHAYLVLKLQRLFFEILCCFSIPKYRWRCKLQLKLKLKRSAYCSFVVFCPKVIALFNIYYYTVVTFLVK